MSTVAHHCIALLSVSGMLFVAACGRTQAADVSGATASEASNPFAGLVETCSNAAPAEAQAKARKYCQCIYKAAADRWTFAYYATHVARCESELESEVSERCYEEANQ